MQRTSRVSPPRVAVVSQWKQVLHFPSERSFVVSCVLSASDQTHCLSRCRWVLTEHISAARSTRETPKILGLTVSFSNSCFLALGSVRATNGPHLRKLPHGTHLFEGYRTGGTRTIKVHKEDTCACGPFLIYPRPIYSLTCPGMNPYDRPGPSNISGYRTC